MKHFEIIDTAFEGRIKLIRSTSFVDERGYFNISFLDNEMAEMGLPEFVRDLHSRSMKNVVRGLHFQRIYPPMAKLMRCTRGQIFMTAVDIKINSSTFLEHYDIMMREGDNLLLWGDADIARGFCALEDSDVQYKCSGHFNKTYDNSILWNDPDIGIPWPIKDPILSPRDRNALTAKEFFRL